ncbi:MAG: sulfotransferase family 2 domain-containing protein [Gemmobacter sp.]|nr:sulfotransferase family 2 domain-containing protein [Gemmobacter sp.]
MSRRFDRFILLANMRTGSNFLEANLNALDGVICHGEAFNPHFIGKKDREEYLGINLADREHDPLALLRVMEAATPVLAGFRFFHDHDPRILHHCLHDYRCAKIVLTRNPVESYISLKIAQATGQWKLGDARRRREAQAHFDAAEFEAHMRALQGFQVEIMHTLQTTGQTAFYIDYDDINDLAVLNGLAAFLGLDARLDAPIDNVKKQNPEDTETKVANPAEMAAALAGLDRFNLSRTPNFEPRRGASVPSYLAAAGAPLLYLPLRGGPEQQVAGWLSSVGATSGLLQAFTQKTLRDWQRANPGARSFTVLRHPLARAHAAFCDRILSGACGEVRGTLKRAYKIDMPPPDRLDRQDMDGHRTAFLQFLRFLKGNLAGQTSVRIDAAWASQGAVLQGFAGMVQPDHILREDRLDQGLAFLADEVGVSALQPPEARPTHPFTLDQIWTPDMEDAARDAYARDYQQFGFAAWRA